MGSCSAVDGFLRGHRSITKLKKDSVPFNSLPAEVRDLFSNVRNLSREEMDEYLKFLYNLGSVSSPERVHGWHLPQLYTFNTSYEYEFVVVPGMVVGISYHLLIDKTNSITYRVDFHVGIPPLVIYNNRELFMRTVHNLHLHDLDTLYFDRYLLDGRRRWFRLLPVYPRRAEVR